MCEGKDSKLTRVWLLVPSMYLTRFDEMIDGFYPSRREAIRQGMTLVLREIKGYRMAPR